MMYTEKQKSTVYIAKIMNQYYWTVKAFVEGLRILCHQSQYIKRDITESPFLSNYELYRHCRNEEVLKGTTVRS